jgi:SAM-dependent methyltransferase
VSEERFFDFAAAVGLTKHLGGLEATREMVELCRLQEGSYVLDVGCGAGATSCYLAGQLGLRVAGVDISEGMVQSSRKMAERQGVSDRVEFRVADAQDLPFDDDLFDAVITESVTAFPDDKQRAVSEYARVTKPGGYVGLNESTWRKVPPPPEVVAWAGQDLGANVNPLTAGEWVALLEGAGLEVVSTRTYTVDTRQELKGLVDRYGCRGMLGIYGRILGLFLRNPAYRAFLKGLRTNNVMPDNIEEYMGYGMYVGRK